MDINLTDLNTSYIDYINTCINPNELQEQINNYITLFRNTFIIFLCFSLILYFWNTFKRSIMRKFPFITEEIHRQVNRSLSFAIFFISLGMIFLKISIT